MPPKTFEEVWRLLHELEGKPVYTLVRKSPNFIVEFTPTNMMRHTNSEDGKGRNKPTRVPKTVFQDIWRDLTTTGFCPIGKYDYRIAAACLVEVRALGVKLDEGPSPHTISLKSVRDISKIKTQMSTRDEVDEEFGDLDRIVVDPDICSGKPTIRGTRIMVTNVLSMMAGGYPVRRVVESYPELTEADVSAALEYASQIIDEEKIIARR